MSERDEFEAFWRREMNVEAMDLCRTEYPKTAPDDQQYMCHETNRAWITWQAARAPQAVPALTDEAAMRVALRIMANLEDRKGVLDGVDDDTKADIADEIAVAILAAPQPSPEQAAECSICAADPLLCSRHKMTREEFERRLAEAYRKYQD